LNALAYIANDRKAQCALLDGAISSQFPRLVSKEIESVNSIGEERSIGGLAFNN
jgi:hypothetical protein